MTMGAELYAPAASGPYISKRDSPVNNSFQWELSECMHTHMQDALTHINGCLLKHNTHSHMLTESRLLILFPDEYLSLDEEVERQKKKKPKLLCSQREISDIL